MKTCKDWASDKPLSYTKQLHQGNILGLFVDSTDKYLFSVSTDDTIRVWLVEDLLNADQNRHEPVWQPAHGLSEESDIVHDTIYEQNAQLVRTTPAVIDNINKCFYVISKNRFLNVFDISDPRNLKPIHLIRWPIVQLLSSNLMGLYRDNTYLFITEFTDMKVYKAHTPSQITPNQPFMVMKNMHFGKISAMCMQEQNDIMITGSRDGDIKIWCLANLSESGCVPIKVFSGIHKSHVTNITIDPKGFFLISTGKDCGIKIFTLEFQGYGSKHRKILKKKNQALEDTENLEEIVEKYKDLDKLQAKMVEPAYEFHEVHKNFINCLTYSNNN